MLARRLLNVLAVAAPTLLLASLFPPSLMLEPTTAAGGDLGSHNYAASVSRHLLLTEHRLTGWVPGNFCGFPLFQMYFPLPFVLMAAVSVVAEPTVAFKLVSVVGVVTLPWAAFFLLTRLATPFPGPALGSILVLPFLLQSGNSAWGGNLQSTLAGEFAFSISLPLALVFLGLSRRVLDNAKAAVACAGIVALIALTHAYTAIWIVVTSAMAIAAARRFAASVLSTGVVYALGLLLCAFWLVPLVWYSPWTTAFKHLWVIGSIVDVFPPLLWPAVVLAGAAPVVLWWSESTARRAYWRGTELLYAGALAAALAYGSAPLFGIVDVRFLPFLQVSLCLLAAAGAGHVLVRWPAPGLLVPVAFLGVVLMGWPETRQLDRWIEWNYQGFERKPLWPVYEGIADHLRGDWRAPRVAYEHSPDNEALGSVRAFENLPLFSGRSTLEGVNFQASVTSPFVFFVQSEISELMSCPFAEWGCSRPDLARGIEHLKMLHVSDLILRSDRMKAEAAAQPGLIAPRDFGPYRLFRLRDAAAGYAVPLGSLPYALVTTDWKADAYRWFKRARSTDAVPVYVSTSVEAAAGRFAGVFREPPRLPPAVTLPEAPSLRESFGTERLVIEGCRPGDPVLIRMSYHPRWRSVTGEQVWLAGPGFMLVYPTQSRLELVYASGAAERVGIALTLLGLTLSLVLLGFGWTSSATNSRPAGPQDPPYATDSTATESSRRLRVWVAALCVSCGTLAVVAGLRARASYADRAYVRGAEEMNRRNDDEALRLFRLARSLEPLSNTAIHSTYFEGMALYRKERWDEARRVFEELLDRFPEAQAAAEAMYHIGLCAERTGDAAAAARAFDTTRRDYPGTTWAGLAEERLALQPRRP